VVEMVKPPRSTGHTPLFQVMLDWNNTPESSLQMPGLSISGWETEFISAPFDLTLALKESAEGIVGELNYATALFDKGTVERYRNYWETLLRAIAEGTDQPVSRLPLLPEAERRQVVEEFNATEMEYPADRCIHQLFEKQVEKSPTAVAVELEGSSLSYCELNARANQIAHYLRSLGVAPDRRVAICMERSFEMVVGMLAVMKAGGAYVPLDPDYPVERLHHMLEDCAPLALLTQTHLLDLFRVQSFPVLDVEQLAAPWRQQSIGNPERNTVGLTSRSLAYVIYTSGSTGKPKGVMNEHRGVVNRLAWGQQAYRIGEDDAVLQKTPYSFDVSVWEFFWPLMAGSRLVLAKPGGHRDPAYLGELIRSAGITTLHFVPSMLQAFLGEDRAIAGCGSVNRVMCSGEALPAGMVRGFHERLPGVALHNLYGPTEASIEVTAWNCAEDWQSTSIGRPIANTQMYILDEKMEPVPVGVTGELYIGGVQVARGYLGRPELTAERFIDSPFRAGERIYKTGDLSRWRANGAIEYLGRNDFQVKIRGFRIELGEIEAKLAQVEGVREVVVVAREEEGREARLVAYYSGEDAPEGERLREEVAGSLPGYMVPGAYVRMERLPLTTSGKLDRKALPAPEGQAYIQREYTEPQGETEQSIAGIWSELLGVERVGRHDDFFELGGHSLLAVRMISRLSASSGIKVTLRDLFTNSTLAGFSSSIGRIAPEALPSNLAPFRRTGQMLPIFFVHSGLGEIGFVNALLPGIDLEIPVYGFAAIGYFTDERPLETAEELAAAYVKSARQIQPRGPYRLAGWSSGGNIAYEMANQLLRAGETVEFLGLLDSPMGLSPSSTSTTKAEQLAEVLCRADLPQEIHIRLKELAATGDTSAMMEALQTARMLPVDLPINVFERYLNVAVTLSKIYYVPPSLPVTVTCFTASDARLESSRGWIAVAAKVIEVPVCGTHSSMVEPPHAEGLGKKISEALALAHTTQPASS